MPSFIHLGNELISHNQIKELVIDENPTMVSFSKAVNESFQNGYAKSYCRELSTLCAKDLLESGTESRDTFTDALKLTRNAMKTKSKSHMFLRSGESITESENSSTHYAFGNCCCDLMTLSAISHSPLVIFECKSNKNTSERAQGMVQVVSHGLSLRHRRQVKHEIKLVLVTPLNWYSTSLPPYKDELENCLDITFEQFDVFVRDKNGKNLLHRKGYLNFLNNLRQHFVLVKSVK